MIKVFNKALTQTCFLSAPAGFLDWFSVFKYDVRCSHRIAHAVKVLQSGKAQTQQWECDGVLKMNYV